ncbi:TPA: hypothetical protein ACS50C_004885 [Salmonella enterica]
MKLVSHKELHNEWMQDDEYRVVVGIAVTGYLPRATVNAKIVGRFGGADDFLDSQGINDVY